MAPAFYIQIGFAVWMVLSSFETILSFRIPSANDMTTNQRSLFYHSFATLKFIYGIGSCIEIERSKNNRKLFSNTIICLSSNAQDENWRETDLRLLVVGSSKIENIPRMTSREIYLKRNHLFIAR